VLLKLGGYGIYRQIILFKFESISYITEIVFAVSVIGAFFLGVLCLRQTDLKSLIAYSSVCHIALVIIGLVGRSSWGIRGVLILILAHGICSRALFCLANFYYERFFTRRLILLKGLSIFFSVSDIMMVFILRVKYGGPALTKFFW